MAFVILDTETTGVDDRAQVVEVGIIDSNGQELYNQLICPTVPIDPSASAVNGITQEMLRDQPSFAQELDKIISIVGGRRVMCYNTPFDYRLMIQSAQTSHQKQDLRRMFEGSMDMMQIFMDYIKIPASRGLSLKLSEAAELMRIESVQDHRAVGDCQMTLALYNAVAARPQPNLDLLHEELLAVVPYWKARNIKKLLYLGM